jgi:hypothetical protein
MVLWLALFPADQTIGPSVCLLILFYLIYRFARFAIADRARAEA